MTEENAEARNTKTKKSRTRSPNYPALDLADAIERARTVFGELGRSRVGDEDVAKALGYNKLHGKSRVVVSTLKKYGLLEPDGDGFRISDDALDIIHLDSDDPDRVKATYAAALKPTLFAELHETYGDNPPADSLLRNYLLKRNFNHNVASDVIRIYRDTMNLVSQNDGEYTAADGSNDERQETQMRQETQKGSDRSGQSGGEFTPGFVSGSFTKQQHYGLSADCDVYLLFEGKPTKEDIDTLSEYLKIYKRRLRSDDSTSEAGESIDDDTDSENGHVAD